jgi:hypothetical protein
MRIKLTTIFALILAIVYSVRCQNQKNLVACDDVQCENGGHLIPESCSCDCPIGYSGTRCELSIIKL